MKRVAAVGLCVCVILSVCGLVSARDPVRAGLRPERPWSKDQFPELTDPALKGLYQEAAVDTYCIVWYDFEEMNWQGWARLDLTAQVNTFFHVDDFAGLGGGIHGMLTPIQGTKSAWCGARPNPSDTYLCAWKTAPGYGNNWDQNLGTTAIAHTGPITLSFHIKYDSEPDYDYTTLSVDDGTGAYPPVAPGGWGAVARFTGRGDGVYSFRISNTSYRSKLRFNFESDNSWSDQDGLWDTDGGCIIDSITVRDEGTLYDFQDFESAAVGAKGAGWWQAGAGTPFGTYSGLKSNLSIGDRDPCNYNLTTQIVFFINSGITPAPGYPGLWETPFCAGARGIEAPCQNELVVSPVIDLKKYSLGCNSVQNGTIPAGDLSQLGGALFRFTVYDDLPLPNLVFYQWFIRNVDASGCPGLWVNDNLASWDNYGYVFVTEDVSRFISSDRVQLALGVIDMCDVWYLQVGNCAQHTPAPWFDNVRLYRYKTAGPQWSYRDIDLFQDNFPVEEAPPWGHVRADMANDLRYSNVPGIDPGDSIVVSCASLTGGSGIDTMPNGYPAVYMHVNAHWIGAGTAPPALGPVIHGAQLQGSVGLWQSTDAGGWDIIQGDYARARAGPVAGEYMFDLDDSLFVPGYIIEYYFTAKDKAGIETALPKWARSTGPYFEFTCLPTGKSDILFVDKFTGRGSWNGVVEDYWMPVFRAVLPGNNQPDKYDVNAPTSAASNSLGSRANAALMRYQYNIVVWDNGDLEYATITDGTVNSDKSNDCTLLVDWMSLAEHRVGLWVLGDDIAFDLTENDLLSTPALTFMATWCGVQLADMSYYDVTGGRTGGGAVNPLVTGIPGSVFYLGGLPFKWYVYGGCPVINRFDCLEKTANGAYAAKYPDYDGLPYYAAIQCEQKNSLDQWARAMWFGFSFMYVRDDILAAPQDRIEIARDVFSWMQEYTGASSATTPAVNKLSQNYPNPFNPMTTIKYDVREKGAVTVKVYNVAGQLVRTLVEGAKDAGSYTAMWDGKNNLGAETASGVYFCKMEAKGFTATKKMVLLR